MALTCDEISGLVSNSPSQQGGPSPPPAHAVFREALSRHHKAERDRSEACLGDIVKILDNRTTEHSELVNRILVRLVEHYSR